MFRYSPSNRFQQCQRVLWGLSLLTIILGLFLLAIPDARAAVQVTLAWDPNSESDLAGYKVYYGTSTRNYAVSYDAGKVTSYTISSLQEGSTFYFAATAYDSYGNESDFSEEVVYVAQAANNAPVAQNGTLSTNQDTATAGTLAATDPDGDSLTFSVVTQGALGTVAITNAATGAYTYTPTAGARGSDTFTFQVADAGGLTSTASIAVTVIAVNHAPVAQNGTLSTNQDTAATGSLTATDPDGDSLAFSVTTQGALGTVAITNAATGAYTYTPTAGARGSDTFTFRVADAGGLTSTASIAVTVIAVNHAPVAQNGTLSTNQDTAATGSLTATDPDGDSLAFSVTTQGALGTVAITNAATGAYTYTPTAGARGSDTFTFRVADAGGLTSTASIAVTIVPVNHAPVAQNGTFSTPQGTLGSGVLVATDSDGDTLTYALATQPAKGSAVITNAATGSYTYTPNTGATGADTFTFLVRDPGNLTGSATVAVTITPVNQTPVASNGALSVVQDTPATSKVNATDADGDTLTYSVVSAAKLGAVALNAATGSFTYTPNANSTGTDTFSFKANDGKADSNVATFTVTINAHVSVRFEAETGVLTAPMVQASDTTASGSKYVYVPNGKGSITNPLAAGGQAAYSFTVPAAGNYRVWARVLAASTADNSFFVSLDYAPSIAWHTALAGKTNWAWDIVADQNDAEPSSFALTAGTHTLIIKQMEDGAKIDAIVITTNPEWIPATVYGDAEDGTIDGWDVFDAAPAGATITNVFNEDRNSHVIQVAGYKTYNGYRLRSDSYTDWNNQSQFTIEWSMKYAETFMVYVEVQTTKGYRYFQYEAIAKDYLGKSSQVRLGLGTDAKNGQWHTFVRDLQADLTKAQPGVTILSVNAFSVRGSGMIDNVKLRTSK